MTYAIIRCCIIEMCVPPPWTMLPQEIVKCTFVIRLRWVGAASLYTWIYWTVTGHRSPSNGGPTPETGLAGRGQ